MKGITRQMERAMRIKSIVSILVQSQEKNQPISRKKLKLDLQMNYGMTSKLAEEYLEIASNSANYVFEND